MTFDPVREFRTLRKQMSGLQQKMNRQMMTGTVAEVKGDKVRLNIGTKAEPVMSPWVRLGGVPSGANGGGHSQYIRPGKGEPMMLLSPGGKVGAHSRAYFNGPVDDFPSVGTADQDGYVHKTGNVTHIMKDGEIKTTVGDVTITQSKDGGISVDAGGMKIEMKGNELRVKPPAKFEKSVSFGGGGEGEGNLQWKGKIKLDGDIDVSGKIFGHHVGPHSDK